MLFENIFRHKAVVKPAQIPPAEVEMSYAETLRSQDARRQVSMRKFVRNHPGSHQPFTKIENVVDGVSQIAWVDQEGKPIARTAKTEREEIQRHLDTQIAANPSFNSLYPNYGEYLTTLATSEGMTPMKDECRFSISMPAYMEEPHIYKTLQKYSIQTDIQGRELDPDLWEINVIINRPTGKTPDNTVDEIKRFVADVNTQRQNEGKKGLNINFVDVELDEYHAGVGTSRKVLTDLILYRSLQRGSQKGTLFVDAEDADGGLPDQHMVFNAIRKLDNNPHLDALRGLSDRTPEILIQNDFLLTRMRLEQFALNLMSRKINRSPETNPRYNFRNNRIPTSGQNATFRAETLALIGGYPARVNVAEGRIVGERVTMIRGDGKQPNTEVVGKVGTRVETSARRIITEIITGQPTYCDEMTDKIREADDQTLLGQISHLSRITPRNRAAFASLISSFIENRALMIADPIAFAHSMMFWMGFKRSAKDIQGNQLPSDYTVDQDGKVSIQNWSNFESALHDYRTRHTRERKPGERWGHHMTPEGEFPKLALRYSLEDLRESVNWSVQGNYVMCLDRVIGRGWNAQVVGGYDMQSGQLFAFKMGKDDYVRWIAQQNTYALPGQDGEAYLKARIPNPHSSLLLSADQFKYGDDVVRVLPPASVTLEKQIQQTGHIKPELVIDITEHLLYGLTQLHNVNLVHFDLKPTNILFDDRGNSYISDFDEVVDLRKKDGISTTTNPRIVPPEALKREDRPRMYTKSGDVFQIGVNMYYMLTGRYPFDPKNDPDERRRMYAEFKQQGLNTRGEQRLAYIKYLQDKGPIIPDEVPEELAKVIIKSLQVDPEQRYQDASEMLKAVERVRRTMFEDSVLENEELPLVA